MMELLNIYFNISILGLFKKSRQMTDISRYQQKEAKQKGAELEKTTVTNVIINGLPQVRHRGKENQ